MKYTTKTWVEAAKRVHNDTIDYSNVEYKNSHAKVHLKCNVCGYDFWQEARAHLAGSGCRVCAMKRVGEYNHNVRNHNFGRLTTEEFIARSKKVHGDSIIYDKVEYKNMDTKVCLICAECGNEFWQTPRHHLHRGHGCPVCNGGIEDTEDDFLKKANAMYGERYDFSKVKYIKSNKKVCVICHNKSKNGIEHGEFMITPNALLSGHGCPHCRQSNIEEDVKDLLTSENIAFTRQKTFDWLRNKLTGRKMRIDFFIPLYNIAIECQGIQHFQPTDFGGFGGEWATNLYLGTVERDLQKKQLCEKNGIRMIYFSNVAGDKENVCHDKNELLRLIKE